MTTASSSSMNSKPAKKVDDVKLTAAQKKALALKIMSDGKLSFYDKTRMLKAIGEKPKYAKYKMEVTITMPIRASSGARFNKREAEYAIKNALFGYNIPPAVDVVFTPLRKQGEAFDQPAAKPKAKKSSVKKATRRRAVKRTGTHMTWT